MPHGTTLLVCLALACADTTSGDDTGGTVTRVGPLSEGPDTDTNPPLPAGTCYADVEVDSLDDGTVDGTGIDLYDPVRNDLLVHLERTLGTTALTRDFVYDTSGNLVRASTDEGSDGIVDVITAWTRDGDGNALIFEIDEDGDLTFDDIRTFTWTEDGQVLTFSRDKNGDGDPDYALTNVYVDDVRTSGTEDRNGDEVTDRWYTYTYDDVGRPTLVEADAQNDGSINYVLTRTYTDPLLLVGTTRIDERNDGKIELDETFAYDADLHLLSMQNDVHADGFLDYDGAWTYTSGGLLATEDEAHFAPPPDDTYQDWIHVENTYDGQLRLVEQFTDGQYVDDVENLDLLARETFTFGGTCP